MKKQVLVGLIALMSLQLTAQTFSSSLSPRIIDITKAFDASNVQIATPLTLQHDYSIEANKKETGYLELTIRSSKNGIQSEIFSLKPLSIGLFTPKFKKNFQKIVEASEGFSASSLVFDDAKISILFAQLISFERTEEQRPIVAKISLLENIPVTLFYYNESTSSTKKNLIGKTIAVPQSEVITLDKAKVELTFYNGFIEKVELESEIFGTKVRFSNLFSIGISSSDGIRKFNTHKLQSFNTYRYEKTEGSEKIVRAIGTRDAPVYPLEINFADIIDYDREIDINANDISPEPTKLVLDEVQKSTKLYKAASTKLFEAIVYSDLFGIFDEENPNGIIQTEASKKFYINTKRIRKHGLWHLIPFTWLSDAVGAGEYINLNAKLTKIEENNKFLSAIERGGINYFSPITIKQHESFSIGGDVNLVFFESQNKKLNTTVDLGLNYGRSGLSLIEENQLFLNTITGSANVTFHVIPEKRYGFIASNRFSYFSILNDDIINNAENFVIQSLENGALASPNNWLNSTQLSFYLSTSVTGKLFVRYTLMTELEDWDNNFSQFQFGYSFYILKQNGKIK